GSHRQGGAGARPRPRGKPLRDQGQLHPRPRGKGQGAGRGQPQAGSRLQVSTPRERARGDREVSGPRQEDRQRQRCSQAVLVPETASDSREGQVSDFIVLDLFACEGGATAGYTEAGATVYAVDLDKNRLARNPAKHKLVADALEVLRRLTRGEAII